MKPTALLVAECKVAFVATLAGLDVADDAMAPGWHLVEDASWL